MNVVRPIIVGDHEEVASDEQCVVIGPVILYQADVIALRDFLNAVLEPYENRD